MNAREVVEAALQAMIAQDVPAHMRWFDDDVVFDPEGGMTVKTSLRYFQENSPTLVPGTGIRLARYEIKHVGSPGPDGEWVGTTLTFELSKNGKAFPAPPIEYETQRSDAWYAVRDDRIVQVKVRSVPQVWRMSI